MRPGRAAAGLCEDFTLETGDVPERPGPGEPSRDLPAQEPNLISEQQRRSARVGSTR